RFGGVVEDGEVFMEPAANRALPHDREGGLVERRFRRWHQEELRREVVDIVSREHVRRVALDGQTPAWEKARGLEEETRRLAGGGKDVATPVADDERVALEDADGVGTHLRSPTDSIGCRLGDSAIPMQSFPAPTRATIPRSPTRLGLVAETTAGTPLPARRLHRRLSALRGFVTDFEEKGQRWREELRERLEEALATMPLERADRLTLSLTPGDEHYCRGDSIPAVSLEARRLSPRGCGRGRPRPPPRGRPCRCRAAGPCRRRPRRRRGARP